MNDDLYNVLLAYYQEYQPESAEKLATELVINSPKTPYKAALLAAQDFWQEALTRGDICGICCCIVL